MSNIIQVKAQKELLFALSSSFYSFSVIHGDAASSLGFLHTQRFFAELQQKDSKQEFGAQETNEVTSEDDNLTHEVSN